MHRLQVEGVNAVAYWQDPQDPTLIWGRRLTYTGVTPSEDPAREETWNHWNLAQYRLDFGANTIKFLRNVTSISAGQRSFMLGDGYNVISAYDPSVFIFRGERFIAFECATTVPGTVAGTCIGPVSLDGRLDLARTSLVVQGRRSPQQTSQSYIPSGSVPKVLVQDSQVILSWTLVRVTPYDPARFAENLDTRAVLMKQDAQGLWRAVGSKGLINGPLDAEDPSATLVYAPATVNGTADIFGLSRIKGRLLSLSAVGDCVLPLAPVDGCYSLDIRISESARWLTPMSVNSMRPIMTDLPRNPNQYFRVIRTPSGRPALLGDWLPPRAETPANRQVAAGVALIYHPVLDALQRLPELPVVPEFEPGAPVVATPTPAPSPTATPRPSATPIPSSTWRDLPMGRERVIQRNYQVLLRRVASVDEVRAWNREIDQRSLSCNELQKGIALSSEYALRRGSMTSTAIVQDLYRSALERDPEPSGLKAHEALFASQGFAAIVNSVVDSVEARSKCY